MLVNPLLPDFFRETIFICNFRLIVIVAYLYTISQLILFLILKIFTIFWILGIYIKSCFYPIFRTVFQAIRILKIDVSNKEILVIENRCLISNENTVRMLK